MKRNETAVCAFDGLIRPVLEHLEFREVVLKDCIHSQFLFQKDRTWFDLSWDCRDQYLEVSLGYLYWFKDVMPRVVVIGDYSHWDSVVTWDSIRSDADFEVVYGRIRDSLPNATSRLEAEFPSLLSEFRKTRNQRIQIDDYIGQEVTIDSLKRFRA